MVNVEVDLERMESRDLDYVELYNIYGEQNLVFVERYENYRVV